MEDDDASLNGNRRNPIINDTPFSHDENEMDVGSEGSQAFNRDNPILNQNFSSFEEAKTPMKEDTDPLKEDKGRATPANNFANLIGSEDQ